MAPRKKTLAAKIKEAYDIVLGDLGLPSQADGELDDRRMNSLLRALGSRSSKDHVCLESGCDINKC